MADADEENPPEEEGGEEEAAEEGGEEEAAEEGGEAEAEEGEEGSKESSFTSSQYASASGGSRSSQFSEGSRSLSVDIELLGHELRELKDFVGVQYERLFQAAKQRRIADLPKALTLAEEKEELLERLQNPDLIALLKQTFKRAERGNFAPRQFQKGTDYLQILKNQSPKFEDYLCELNEAIASIEDIIKKKEKEAEEVVEKEEEEGEGEDEEEEEREKEEMPEELVKYKVILEERTEKLNSVNNMLIRYLIEESCLDSYIVQLDLARAFAFVREQSSHIEKLLDYIDLQRKHMDADSPPYEEWSSIGSEKEHLGHKVEQRSKKVEEMRTYYMNQEEDDRDQTVARLMRKDMDELIRSQSLYIQKLRSCIEAQAPYVYEDDDILDTTEIAAESTYISKYVDEWLMFNGMEFKNQSQAESELELLTRLKEQLEGFIAELSSELVEIGGEPPPAAAPAEEGGEEAGDGDGEEEGEGGGEGEGEGGGEEEEEGEAQGPGAAGEGDGKGEESLAGWLLDIEIRKKYLAKMIQQLSAALNTIEKNRQIIERRAIYGEKKVPKKRRQMPKMSELGSVESLNMPGTVSELKEFSKNLVQKYNCLFKVYALRLQLNEEKRRQERLRNQIDRIIESTHLQKKGDFFQMQLKNAWATVAALQNKLRENRRKALDKCETLQHKIDKSLGKIEHMQNEVGEFQAKLAAKVVVAADPATAQRK